MITVRHIERLFSHHQHPRLYRELIAGRPEASIGLDEVLSRVVPIAALGMIRLDELSQSHTSMYRRLLNVVLTSQQPPKEQEAGWGDAMTTAVALRALFGAGGSGHGAAVDRGLEYLASLQKEDGLWPREGLRRMPADTLASAFVLMQLGDRAAFRRAVRFGEAVAWFDANASHLDGPTRRLWAHASVRCRMTPAERGGFATLWTPAAHRRPAA
jgi:hypothetical protein